MTGSTFFLIQYLVATAKLSTLFKLLFGRWKGSLIRLVWKDLLIYLGVYYTLHIVYRFGLDRPNQKIFEAVAEYFKGFNKNVPLAFVLGFFCQQVFSRWWDQYQTIPWPFGIAVFVSSTLEGYDEVGRALRRTIMRYVCKSCLKTVLQIFNIFKFTGLSLTMVFRVLSPRVKQRFPKTSDLIEAGLVTQNELQIILDMDQKFPGYSKNWLPLCWAAALVKRARSEGRIPDDLAVMTIISELNKFRGSCGVLMVYNQINVPLVYVHVVTIAVYSYFLTELMAQQIFQSGTIGSWKDFFPISFALEFLFYMGWLKVAETMMNPFGSDDDDFEVNYMIDRNLQMSYLIVDEMHNEHPELLKDQYWNEIPKNLPDKHKEDDDKSDEKGEPTDLFDVVETKASRISIRRTTIYDVEAPEAAFEDAKTSSTLDDMVPRSTVISEIYNRKEGVEVKQSMLEREMEKIRLKELYALLDRKSETESSNESIEVKKSNLEADNNDDTISAKSSQMKLKSETAKNKKPKRVTISPGTRGGSPKKSQGQEIDQNVSQSGKPKDD